MKSFLICTLFLVILQNCTAPPPRRQEKPEEKHEDTEEEGYGFEYDRYLKEVIEVLESDPEFKRKLEVAEEADIRNGKIAHELEYVNHNVRSKLDEIKRSELERLRLLAQREYELTNDIDTDHIKITPEHLHHENQHTFEIEDLKKLINKVTKDLNEADKKRREEFKEYEMQKEFENQEKLKHLEGAEKEFFEKQLKDNETKHKQHDPLHHPGSKQQLEEVWEKQDHMDSQDFNPKVFFQLHDVDGNGFWDQNEVKALFINELNKMYEAGAPEDDMKERAEELERMREHVFKEADKNQDQMISFQEFMDQTKQPDFNKDPGWESLDQQQVYTHEDYLEFERRRQEDIQRMVQQGLLPPQPVYHPDPYQQHHPGAQQHFPQGNYPQYQQGHPNQQVHLGQPQYGHPGQGVHPGQQPYGQAQGHPGQPIHLGQQPYDQGHPGQQGLGHPGQPPYDQGHPAQYQQAHPAQYQQHPQQPSHPGQIQQGQVPHPGQIQQGQVPHPAQIQQGQVPHPAQIQQGQVPHPGQIQQGQVPHPAQLPQGQVPHPAQLPQGQVPHPAQLPQGQVPHPAQLSQGQVPQQAQQPPAQLNQNQQPASYQQGQVNQGHPNVPPSNQGIPPQGQVNQVHPNQGIPHQGHPNQGIPAQGHPDPNSIVKSNSPNDIQQDSKSVHH